MKNRIVLFLTCLPISLALSYLITDQCLKLTPILCLVISSAITQLLKPQQIKTNPLDIRHGGYIAGKDEIRKHISQGGGYMYVDRDEAIDRNWDTIIKLSNSLRKGKTTDKPTNTSS